MTALLAVESLSVSYARSGVAIRDLSFSVEAGKVVAILGANGAGKTSTLRAIGGFQRSEDGRVAGGQVLLNNVPIQGLPPHSVARRRVAIIPERTKVFAALTVKENLDAVKSPTGKARRRELEEFVFQLFDVLSQRGNQLAGLLSGGERQMLAVARALLLDPILILADELSFGIAPILLQRILEAVRQINLHQGVSILIVEQNAPAAFSIADHVLVLEAGQLVSQGSPAELTAQSNIREIYFGAPMEQGDRRGRP